MRQGQYSVNLLHGIRAPSLILLILSPLFLFSASHLSVFVSVFSATMDPKTHPAITVSNIKTFIPITLEMETSQYSSWAELFKIHCRAFQVLDHLSPRQKERPAAASSEADKQKSTDPTDDVWDRLDAIVLQWIYGTISNDLLSTILRPDSTACYAWTALNSIFHDNTSYGWHAYGSCRF